MPRGLFITLEGNEGCGKTTQIKALYHYLKVSGVPVLLTREPGGTRIGNAIRTVLLDGRNHKMTPVCETLLYMASRAQLAREVILPALEKGQVVLCDRWVDATVAYQGYGGGIDVRWIESLGKVASQGAKPDLTIFLDLPVAVGLRRAKSFKPADRIEQKKLSYHKKVRAGYLKIASREPKRFRSLKIKPSDTIWVVEEKVRQMIDHVLG